MMTIRGILFDKDDTIIDLETFWRKPVRMAAEYAVQLAAGRDDKVLCRALELTAGFQNDRLIPESPVAAGTNRDIVDAWSDLLRVRDMELTGVFQEEICRYLENACIQYGEVKAKADFSPLLEELRRRGIVLGIATSDNYESTVRCLRELDIDRYFPYIFSADRVERSKPDPESAVRFCGIYGLDPREVAMVGDSKNDMRFALNSGLTGIFYRPDGWEGRLPPGAQICVRDLRQIQEVIQKKKSE